MVTGVFYNARIVSIGCFVSPYLMYSYLRNKINLSFKYDHEHLVAEQMAITHMIVITMGSATGLKLGGGTIIQSEPKFNINLYKIF